jgi:hypothetical protein
MMFAPDDPTPEQQPSRELLVNNVRSAAMAQHLLREALLADIAGKTTHEQRMILNAHKLKARRTRKLMRAPGA